MGVSHFLEHMMFKGTPGAVRRRGEPSLRRLRGRLQRLHLARADRLLRARAAGVPAADAADLLGEILRPSLREADFDMEKKVILEEIGMYDDRPEWVLQDRLLERHFGSAGGGRRAPRAGVPRARARPTRSSALTPDRMRAYFDKRYSPGNVAVAAAGNLDFAALVARAGGALRRLGVGGRPTRDDARRLAAGVRRFADVDARPLAPLPRAWWPRPRGRRTRSGTPRRCSACCSATPDNSRLHWALVDPGLADEAAASFQAGDGPAAASPPGSSWRWATCDPGRAAEVEEKLLGVIDATVARPRLHRRGGGVGGQQGGHRADAALRAAGGAHAAARRRSCSPSATTRRWTSSWPRSGR